MLKRIIAGFCCIGLLATMETSCLKEGEDTLVLPAFGEGISESVIPENMQDSLEENGFVIHTGNTPPHVEGHYIASPLKLVYASDGYQAAEFQDLFFSFSNQSPRGVIFYKESQADTVSGVSRQAQIIGQGNEFTLYCIQDICTTTGVWQCRTATLVSGSMVDNGITDLQYAVLILNAESSYQGNPVAPVGTMRIFSDGDSLATKIIE